MALVDGIVVCCSMLQCVAVCCSVLQCVAVHRISVGVTKWDEIGGFTCTNLIAYIHIKIEQDGPAHTYLTHTHTYLTQEGTASD